MVICRFNVIAIKTLPSFFIEIEKNFLKFPQKSHRRSLIAKQSRTQRKNVDDSIVLLKTVWHKTVVQNREPRN